VDSDHRNRNEGAVTKTLMIGHRSKLFLVLAGAYEAFSDIEKYCSPEYHTRVSQFADSKSLRRLLLQNGDLSRDSPLRQHLISLEGVLIERIATGSETGILEPESVQVCSYLSVRYGVVWHVDTLQHESIVNSSETRGSFCTVLNKFPPFISLL
jgi:hypothetical protein